MSGATLSTDALDVRRAGLRLTAAAGTSTGRRYSANFDVCHLSAGPSGEPVMVVADGMGDSRGSAVAGRTAVDIFVSAVGSVGSGAAGLRAAVAEAQRQVCAAGAKLGELTGCTLTALVADAGDPGAVWVTQVGDSRVYRLRGGLLELLTVDHTMAWLGAVNGWYAADSPAAASARYQLTRYVGHPERPEPDLLNVALRPGDVLLLCTDGVAEQVPYQRLAELLGSGRRPAGVVASLLSDALAAGGHDNATAIVLDVAVA